MELGYNDGLIYEGRQVTTGITGNNPKIQLKTSLQPNKENTSESHHFVLPPHVHSITSVNCLIRTRVVEAHRPR